MGDKSKLYYVLLHVHSTPGTLSDVPVPLPEMLGMRLEKQERNFKGQGGIKSGSKLYYRKYSSNRKFDSRQNFERDFLKKSKLLGNTSK